MESERIAREWNSVCAQIKNYEGIDAAQINAFFSRLQPQAMSDGFLMLTADNDFIKTWIERNYLSYIERALKDIHGLDYMVVVEVDTNQQPAISSTPSDSTPNVARETPQATFDNNVDKTTPDYTSQKPANNVSNIGIDFRDRIPSLQSIYTQKEEPLKEVDVENNFHSGETTELEPEIDSKVEKSPEMELSPTTTLTFENFVIGASNRMAYSMAVAVAEAPGKESSLNPLFIYGKSGLGKTHLLRAIQNYISINMPQLKTVYVDSAELLDDYMNAAATHDKEKLSYKLFKNHYEAADVLLIDDVQYLQGKKQTLDIVFQIFNKLTSQGKQVVLSADRAPKNIDIDERYSSRFNSGGTFDIQPPEFEVKLGIVRNFIDENKSIGGSNFNIDDDVQRYIAENSSSNIRELKSAVTKVIFQMNAFRQTSISLNEVKSLLENHFTGGAMKKLNIADIQKQVESYYKVSHADLIGKKRSRNIVYARQVAIYLSRHMLDLPFSYIGKSFGGRDHTTIMYSVTNVEEKMKENIEIREELETIRQMIKEA